MIKLRVIQEIVILILLKILFDIAYIMYVNPLYAYMGFTLDYDVYKWLLSNLFLIALFFLLKSDEKTYSAIFLKILLVIMIIPTLSLYGLKGTDTMFLVFFILSFAVTIVVAKLPKISIWPIKLNITFLYTLLASAIIAVFLNLLIFNGLPTLTALNLLDVYEVRSNVNYGLSIMGYLVPWLAKVINPFLIGLFIYRKKYRWSLLFCFIQFILYLYTGHKSFLFSPIVIISFMYFVQKSKIYLKLITSIFIVVLLSLLLFMSNVSGLTASLFIRRTFFLTSQNYFYYYDFFSNNEFMMLSHSLLENIIPRPYTMEPQNIIGEVYYYNSDTWVNTGYLGDAYMNFGFLGMLVFSIFLGFLLLLIDSINTSLPIKIAALFIPMFSLFSGAFFTSLLTGGILLGVCLIYFYSLFKENQPLGEHYDKNNSFNIRS